MRYFIWRAYKEQSVEVSRVVIHAREGVTLAYLKDSISVYVYGQPLSWKYKMYIKNIPSIPHYSQGFAIIYH